MRLLTFSKITVDDLTSLARIDDRGATDEPWAMLARGDLSAQARQGIEQVVAGLRRFPPGLVNEATIRARVVVPLLTLVEVDRVAAYADVPLAARLPHVELTGVADAALGQPFAGELRAPFLVVVEAKRGIESHNPVPQLYAEMLAAGWMNAQGRAPAEAHVFGCYTVGDCWTFVQMTARGLDTDSPALTVCSSPEYGTRTEAETIVRTLQSIVRESRPTRDPSPS
jgi:hypothetical protein